ncbi:membrane protein [Kutzneria sp. CA-103260]|nr:membrane protein [Kutzneria sp. CA-103260]
MAGSTDADAHHGGDLHGRWQALQLLQPVFDLLNRAAPRADFDHRRYDLAQLVLRLIDYVVLNQASLEGSVSPDSIVDHLTQLSRRMNPGDPARPWTKIAKLVLATMLNDGRPHEAVWREPAADQEPWSEPRPFRFRLLRLGEGEDGATVTATDPAIVLFLQALNSDLADRALALKLLVEIQMQAREFDKALATAREATRTAQGLSASLREKLDDTRRDVRSVDWHGEMPSWLDGVMSQITQQIEKDRQLRDLAERASEDDAAAAACRDIAREVRRGEDVWLRLERHVTRAIPVFLAAQETQRFQPRGLAAAVDLANDLLVPALAVADDQLATLSETLVAGGFPPRVPAQWGIDELTRQLLREPLTRDQRDPEPDDPGDLGEAIGDSIPDDIASCAAEILAAAAERPTQLSELLAAARTRSGDVADSLRLLDIMWGAALYVFVAGGESGADERPHRADLAAAVTALVAVDRGAVLVDERFDGPDLLLATPAALDQLDADEESRGVA